VTGSQSTNTSRTKLQSQRPAIIPHKTPKQLFQWKETFFSHSSVTLVSSQLHQSYFEIPPFMMALQAKAGKSSGSSGFGATSCTYKVRKEAL